VLYRHNNFNMLANLAHIEVPYNATIIIDELEIGNFSVFSDFELRILFEHLCGEKYFGFRIDDLMQSVQRQCKCLEFCDFNGFQVAQQANCIKDDNEEYYRFSPGCDTPSGQQDLFYPAALVTVPGLIPRLVHYVPAAAAPVHATAAAGGAAYVTTPRTVTPRTTEIPSAPKAGSKTGQVWTIAEELFKAQPEPVDFKTLRGLIIAACEVEGINSSTASVQYGAWKKTKL
jgi:hypothetical protein